MPDQVLDNPKPLHKPHDPDVETNAAGGPADFELRAFYTDQNLTVREDPVTGSLNASLAQWLIADDRMPERYVAGQGQCLGRDGRVHIERDEQGQVWVGGSSVICIEGTAHI